MAGRGTSSMLGRMQTLLGAGTFGGLSDRELLDLFLAHRDEVAELAFAVLVERHGPMVLGVCRRLVGDPHEAEDAFQATFLVLVRRARSVRVEDSLGRWLFGVATRVAAHARSDARRRKARERNGLGRLDATGSDTIAADAGRAEIRELIAQEIAALPARYQAAVLLCDLEGTSHEEASRRLGWPIGTVKSRLSRARACLRDRLTRRGVSPADFSIATALLPAAPSSALVESTGRAALAVISGRMRPLATLSAPVADLTQGVLRTMVFRRIQLAAAALLMAAVGSAALFGQASDRGQAGQPAARRAPVRVDSSEVNDDRIEIEMLVRAWADAFGRLDTAVVGRILADEYEGIDWTGTRHDRASYLARVRQPRTPVQVQELKVRLFGQTGIVFVRTTWNSPVPRERRQSATKVYVKRRGRWQCVASQSDSEEGLIAADPHHESMSKIAELLRMSGNDPKQKEADSIRQDCMRCHVAKAVDWSEKLRQQIHSTIEQAPTGRIPITMVHSPADCEVERVHVKEGQDVKKGAPLVDLLSTYLAFAKNDFELAQIQWDHDRKVLDYKAPLAKGGTLPQKELLDAENAEAQSRVKMRRAREALAIFGLTDEDIAHIKKEEGIDRTRFTLRAPSDGKVIGLEAVPEKAYAKGNTVELRVGARRPPTIEQGLASKFGPRTCVRPLPIQRY
ncbi:MAG: sigma-70 family RNA polymerase sigma factor [Isosphaeraceae bacterium]